MRWLLTLFILVCPGGILIYLLGCWLLGQRPWDLWKEAQPDMYDGKEPYEQWQAKMHAARATQMKEESDESAEV